MNNEGSEEVLELVHRLETRQRRRVMATFLGLLLAAGIAGAISRLSYFEAKKLLAGMGVLSEMDAGSPEELDRMREAMLQMQAETDRLRTELDRARREKLQPETEEDTARRATTQAQEQPRADNTQLVEMRGRINQLEQDLSITQEDLKQARQSVAILSEEADRYRQDGLELRRRADEQLYQATLNQALAYTYRKEPKDSERAEAAYRQVIRLAEVNNIRDPMTYSAFAVFLQEQRRFAEAETMYKKALDVDPQYGTALNNLGTLYEAMGDIAQALEKYRAAGEVGMQQGRENYLRLKATIKQ